MAITTNPDLFMYCVYRAGGVGRYVDIEDVFEQAYKVAPSRFGWRSKSYPSDKAADQALRDALKDKREGKDLILLSPNRQGLQLTAEGVAWVQNRLVEFERLVEDRASAGHERASQRYLVALESNGLVQAYAEGKEALAGRRQFADLLRLTPDADPRAWRERLESYRSAAQRSGRDLVLRFCERLEAEHPDWFGATR